MSLGVADSQKSTGRRSGNASAQNGPPKTANRFFSLDNASDSYPEFTSFAVEVFRIGSSSAFVPRSAVHGYRDFFLLHTRAAGTIAARKKCRCTLTPARLVQNPYRIRTGRTVIARFRASGKRAVARARVFRGGGRSTGHSTWPSRGRLGRTRFRR